jgi:hypothetical protein
MKRFLLWLLRGFFLISWFLLFGYFYVSYIGLGFGFIISDVSKRLESPDHTKTALLIRRKALDLNFLVRVKGGGNTSTLYFSPDYNNDPTVDWNERIQWSNDSSLLVFSTDEIHSYSKSRPWAFDFRNNVAVTDQERIFSLLRERNSK